MRKQRGSRTVLMWAASAAVILLAACSGSSTNRTPAPAATATPAAPFPTPSIPTGTPAASVANAGGAPADCDYAKKFRDAALPFALTLLGAGLSGGTPGPAATADAIKAYDAIAAATTRFIAQLQLFTLPPDLKQYNDRLIGAFQAVTGEIQQARQKAAAGDLAGAGQIIQQATAEVQAASDDADRALPEIARRINACPT
jgi:hypothetical protein